MLRKYVVRSKKEKLAIVRRNLSGEAAKVLAREIVTDVTYIKYDRKWYYLAAYMDLFNNEIVEWELSDTFDNFLVMRPAELLLKKKMSVEHQVLLHSDQGVQYSSAGYCNLLREYNVIQSMSRAETLTTMLFWKVSGEDSRIHCGNIFGIGKVTIYTVSLIKLFIISITSPRFIS